jgi:hypothetical protein
LDARLLIVGGDRHRSSNPSSSSTPPIRPTNRDQVGSSTIIPRRSRKRPRPASHSNLHIASDSHSRQRMAPGSTSSGLLFQARPLSPAPHPCRVQTGTQGAHHGSNGFLQSGTGRPREKTKTGEQ